MIKKCPNCGYNHFVVLAHVVQKWLVNKCGLCEEVLDDFVSLIHEADDSDIWRCDKCGYKGPGRNFNVEE